MQRTPATIEEQLILKAIGEECAWENLPKRLQSFLSSKEEWHRRIIEHCIKKRLQWNTSFAHKVCKEGEYYEEMMRYLRRHLALFPYHLAEYICRVMRISPFKYYCDIIFEVMKNEQPYDSIPNFSAADALRLTGIGRNEFIDLMIKCRSKKIMWKLNKSIAKELLPLEPVEFVIEPWWGVCLVNFTLEEFKKLTEEETATIDKICKEEANSFILFDPVIIRGLYNRGLVYFDVPVYPDDRFKVSRLEGFVSNREQQYEDPIEELLYAVFVVSSESSTVAELATTLQSDLSQLQAAASFACRLGWAVKLIDVASILQEPNISGFSKNSIGDEEDIHAAINSLSLSGDRTSLHQGDALWTDNPSPAAFGYSRVAFIVDANITSYLMMGSVSPGLKSHAITLYEAGKLGHTSIADLCTDLATLEGAKFEGELQEFANHAFSLRCILECLTSGGIANNQVENVAATSINKDANSFNSDMRNGDLAGEDPEQLNSKADVSSAAPPKQDADGNLPVAVQISDAGKEERKAKKYRVDILRCESLASLAPATLDRLFHRDYDIVMSMVPLPPSSILPGSKGPIHLGPPSNSSMTPWMKLVLYSVLSSGPLSVVLMKGQCLRLLPAPLAGCEKALIWSWDGSNTGGLGGKFEGNLVKGSILLHCLNSLLRYSAVLVQPLSKHDLDNNGKIVTHDFPLPLKNSDGSVVSVGPEFGLSDAETSKLNMLLQAISSKLNLWTIGYIRVLRLYKEREPGNLFADDENYEWVPLSVEFGVPLFSPKLCSSICRRVVGSQLLQTDFFNEYDEAMQGLRSRLRDVCAEYQATGPTARLLYQKELQKEKDSSRRLMTYASGKWNPLTDPSSPISGASSENQRLKLANRQRYRTEILSFDGNILRSYSLTPDYEAAARDAAVAAKSESEDGDSKEVVLPGVNLLFDGSELRPFEIGACLQARQPISLIAEASAASATLAAKQKV